MFWCPPVQDFYFLFLPKCAHQQLEASVLVCHHTVPADSKKQLSFKDTFAQECAALF